MTGSKFTKSAFPMVNNGRVLECGISTREYFAAMAMQGILAANPKETWGNMELPVPDYIANLSIEFADAILERL